MYDVCIEKMYVMQTLHAWGHPHVPGNIYSLGVNMYYINTKCIVTKRTMQTKIHCHSYQIVHGCTH